MAMNRVQFQSGLSMADFLKRYGSEAQCEVALFAARWPEIWLPEVPAPQLHQTYT